jgi:hypothetical protein
MWSAFKENEYMVESQWRIWKILLEWFQQMCSENVPKSRPTLCQKTTDIALHQQIGIWNEEWSLIFCLIFTQPPFKKFLNLRYKILSLR